MRPSQRLHHCASELADIAANPPREVNGPELARLSARILAVAAHVAMGERTSTQETSPAPEPTLAEAFDRLRKVYEPEVVHAVTCKLFPDPHDEREPVGPCTCGAISNR